jgi:hypothetical protein
MAGAPDEKMDIPNLELGKYRHYKGKTYKVLGVALNSEDMQLLVVYKSLYKSRVSLWARPYDMFVSSVVVAGVTMPRFAKLD